MHASVIRLLQLNDKLWWCNASLWSRVFRTIKASSTQRILDEERPLLSLSTFDRMSGKGKHFSYITECYDDQSHFSNLRKQQSYISVVFRGKGFEGHQCPLSRPSTKPSHIIIYRKKSPMPLRTSTRFWQWGPSGGGLVGGSRRFEGGLNNKEDRSLCHQQFWLSFFH